MKNRFLLFILGALCVLTGSETAFSQQFEPHFFVKNGDTLPFRIIYPPHFEQTNKYPVLFFLHGAGERGRDNQKQLVHGGQFFSDSINMYQFPAIVIFPQCAENDYWANVAFSYDENGKRTFHFQPDLGPTKAMQLLTQLVDSIILLPSTNRDQLYVGGLSMGGMGTFELLYRKPDHFAAAFPICGGGDTATCATFAKKLPLWIFHGEVDDVVPAAFSSAMAAKIASLGGRAQLTIYPGVNHNAWDFVFKEKDLIPWLFKQRKD